MSNLYFGQFGNRQALKEAWHRAKAPSYLKRDPKGAVEAALGIADMYAERASRAQARIQALEQEIRWCREENPDSQVHDHPADPVDPPPRSAYSQSFAQYDIRVPGPRQRRDDSHADRDEQFRGYAFRERDRTDDLPRGRSPYRREPSFGPYRHREDSLGRRDHRSRSGPFYGNKTWRRRDDRSPTPRPPSPAPRPPSPARPPPFQHYQPRTDRHSRQRAQNWKNGKGKRRDNHTGPLPPQTMRPWPQSAASGPSQTPVDAPAPGDAHPPAGATDPQPGTSQTPVWGESTASTSDWGFGFGWGGAAAVATTVAHNLTVDDIFRRITEQPELAPAGVVGKSEEETKRRIRVWKWLACIGSQQTNREGFVSRVLYLLRTRRYTAFVEESAYPIEEEHKTTSYLGGYEADTAIMRHLADCGFPSEGEWLDMATQLAVAREPRLLLPHDPLA
ncbi:hypothetical protein GLOTRDRAFT_97181 [Gloeophyllum trabeum ATCC 11539]|uniref:Uncharacterized protein n=1 Tax=Gloeophyllum trabeum (strain ATCC 11539 / FP-39264 / Madison 617) TaxID=670483 RepID=S7PS10_GLOTA|nr:uncharacterized protein GLOTRDRAFT_97181 [Gloeophyllum trabeum ATCC 11539]EPQ50178.1 hypothetical protein GLOTRDRAFT_97181 [Gloeophyllum trabeum ATCC 11539]